MKNSPFLLLLIFINTVSISKELDITIYNNISQISHTYQKDLVDGVNKVDFQNISSGILYKTAVIDGASVLEKTFSNKKPSLKNLLDANIGKKVSILKTTNPETSAFKSKFHANQIIVQILSNEDYPIVKYLSGNNRIIRAIRPDDGYAFIFNKVPDHLVSTPTIKTKLLSSTLNDTPIKLTYLSKGLTWNADYTIILSSRKVAKIIGEMTIENNTETIFDDATVSLVAGKVNLAKNKRIIYRDKVSNFSASRMPVSNVKSNEFSEGQYIFNYPNPLSLTAHETKQVPFINKSNVKFSKNISITGSIESTWTSKNPSIGIIISNNSRNLNKQLPQGNARFYQKSKNGSIRFIGESYIDNFDLNQVKEFSIGKSFDISTSLHKSPSTPTTPKKGFKKTISNTSLLEIVSASTTTKYLELSLDTRNNISDIRISDKNNKIVPFMLKNNKIISQLKITNRDKSPTIFKITFNKSYY